MRKALLVATCICVFICYCGMNSVFAQPTTGGQEGTKTITTAVPFLNVGPDSRAGGMGEVGVAVTGDANSQHWNPAALAFVDNKLGFSMSYSPWLRALGIPDINLAYLSGYSKVGKNGTLGASFRYFSLGTIEFTNLDATPIGSDKPNELALDVSYSLKVTPDLSAAIALRFFNSRLASSGNLIGDLKPVTSISGDLAFFYNKDFKVKSAGADLPVNFSAGLNISNIGPKVSYTSNTSATDFIPINMRLGYAFKFQLDEYNSLTFANDVNKLLVPSEGGRSDKGLLEGMFGSFTDAPGGFSEEISEFTFQVGLEYWYRGLFAARIGYFYEDPAKGNRKFITLGAGLKYNVFGVHFSYLAPLQQNHPLQNTLRFTLTYDFNPSSDE